MVQYQNGLKVLAIAFKYSSGSTPQTYAGSFTIGNCDTVMPEVRFYINGIDDGYRWGNLNIKVNSNNGFTYTASQNKSTLWVYDITYGFNPSNCIAVRADGTGYIATTATNTVQAGHTYLVRSMSDYNTTLSFLNVIKVEDTTPPTVNISLTNYNWCYSTYVNISAADDNALASITVNGVAIALSQTQYYITRNGRYTVVATDTAGNQASKYIDVTNLDYTKPNVNIKLN